MAEKPPSKFWSVPQNRETLRSFLRVALHDEATSVFSVEHVFRHIRPRDPNPKHSHNLRLFINGKVSSPRRTEDFGPVLLFLVDYIDASQNDIRAEPIFGEACLLRDSYLASADEISADRDFDASGEFHASESRPQGPTLEKVIAEGLKANSAEIQIYHDRVFDHRSQFLVEIPEKRRFERYYICYRYHTSPGMIVKSHLVLKGRDSRYPGIIRFTNHFIYNENDPPHKAVGVVLPMRESVYLIGAADNGAGLTQVALPTLSGDHTLTGLYQSFDEAGDLICGRIVLKPTMISSTEEGGFGVRRINEVAAELRQDIAKIRNYIPFKLNHDICIDGVVSDEEEMVRIVNDLIRDPAGKSLFTYKGDGLPFNPAATKEYTFNAALGTWNSREPDVRGPEIKNGGVEDSREDGETTPEHVK